jgi:O-antigen/teichoic acid export membrane protein
MARHPSRRVTFRKHMGGMAWTGTSQLLSSLSNVVASLALARSGGADALGLFTVAFTVYLTVLGFQQAIVNDPLLTIPSENRVADDHSRLGLGAALVYLVPVSILVLIIGILLQNSPIIVLSVFLPVVCIQDVFRHLFFRHHRPARAALLDGIWLMTSVLGWGLITSSGSADVAVAVWATGGAVSAAVGALVSRSIPRGPRESVRWWLTSAKSLGGFLGIDRVLQHLFIQVYVLGLAAILGPGDVGRLRGAEIVLGPVGLILTAFQVFIMPRLASSRSKLTNRNSLIISVSAAVVTLLGAVLLWIVSPWLLPILYGETFELPPVLIIAIGVRMTIRALAIGPGIHLKVLQRGGPIASARLAEGVIGIPIMLGVAALFGLVPAAWSQSVPAALFVGILFMALLRQPAESNLRSRSLGIARIDDDTRRRPE